jgi:methyl-accepting chemotaxis protein
MFEQMRGRRIPLRVKVAAAMVVAALVPTGIAGVLSYREASGALTQSATGTLEAVRASRADGLSRYSNTIERQVQDSGLHYEARTALVGFDTAYQTAGPENLREIYLGTLGDLTDGGDGSNWTAEHVEHHESFRDFQRSYGYYDLFIFNTAGDLVYSVFKEDDFATNFIDGPYADSGLGVVFRGALEGEVTWDDYEPYAPSFDAPAAFVAAPLIEEGAVVGVLALQMPIDEISSIMQNNVGLGETGETYLVGADALMRSQSRFSEENTILSTEVDTETVAAGLAGETGTSTILDYRGIEVLSSFQPVSVFGQDYVLIAEQDAAEALEATGALAWQVTITSLLAAMAMGIGGIWFAKRIGDPIARVAEASTRLAVGDTNVELEVTSNDEIGDMIGAFGETVSYLKELSQLAGTVAAGDLTPDHTPAGN